MYQITNQPYVKYSARFEFETKGDRSRYYIEYDDFFIGNESEFFQVKNLGRTTDDNTAGGWLDGNPTFRTWDKDTDRKYGQKNNGFWYSDRFTPQQFNGNVATSEVGQILWTEFKIRPNKK